jgi:hypothetical protein
VKARIVEQEAAIARQRQDKHVSAATGSDATIEDEAFSMQSLPKLYNKDQQQSDMCRSPEAHLTLNGQNTPFIYHVKYLGVIFDKSITWRLHIRND